MSTYAQRRAASSAKNGHGERRRSSRERLIEAARTLILQEGFFSLNVDDIARAADLSRAGFYLHFPGKEAVLVEIVREESARLDPLYRWFANKKGRVTKKHARDFVQLALRLSKRSRKQMMLFYQATGYSTDIWQTFAQNRKRHIDMLGESLSAFRDCKRGAAIERKRRARALLLMFQLEQITVYAAFADAEIETDAASEAVADALYGFIEEYTVDS